MKPIPTILVVVTLGLLPSEAGAAAAQARATIRLPAASIAKPVTGTIIVRGGPLLSFAHVVDPTTTRKMIRLGCMPALGRAGPQGLALKEPSQCAFADKEIEYFPPAIHFEAAGETFFETSGRAVPMSRRSSMQEYLSDINHFWSFDVELKHGYFEAKAHRRLDVPILTDAAGAPGSVAAKAAAMAPQATTSQASAGRAEASASRAEGTPVVATGAATATAAATREAQRPKSAPLQTGERVLPDPVEKAGLNPQPLPPKEAPIAGEKALPKPVEQGVTNAPQEITPDQIDKGLEPVPVGQAVLRPAEKVEVGVQTSSAAVSRGARAAGSPAAATPAPAADTSSVSTVASNTSATAIPATSAAATSAARPANLLEADDRAIIVVGGKKMAAGEAKRQIRTELQQSTARVPAYSVSRIPVNLTNANTPLINVPGKIVQGAHPTGGGLPGAGRSAALKMDCATNWPRISNIQGSVTSGGRFTINGSCFGTQTGYVEIIGQFAGGNLRPSFLDWKDSAIVVQMPALTSTPDHTVAISVRRGGDQKQSVAKQERFVAARHAVDVPLEMWSPTGSFFSHVVTPLSTVMYLGTTSGHPGPTSTNFQLRVNPACALETLDVPASIGRVDAVNGWENGSPNEANVQIVWSPACTMYEVDLLFAQQRERHCGAAFQLQARASCPSGVVP